MRKGVPTRAIAAQRLANRGIGPDIGARDVHTLQKRDVSADDFMEAVSNAMMQKRLTRTAAMQAVRCERRDLFEAFQEV
jgi:hypothetical protein